MDKNNSLSFSTRKNKTKDLTEYYNFMYQYKNDCLAASIEYNKNFYNDRDVQQNENLVFKLTIIPIGETSSPNFID
jgi:LPS-assembly protein